MFLCKDQRKGNTSRFSKRKNNTKNKTKKPAKTLPV